MTCLHGMFEDIHLHSQASYDVNEGSLSALHGLIVVKNGDLCCGHCLRRGMHVLSNSVMLR